VPRVLMTGRLTRDPEMRSLASGKAVTQGNGKVYGRTGHPTRHAHEKESDRRRLGQRSASVERGGRSADGDRTHGSRQTETDRLRGGVHPWAAAVRTSGRP